MSLSAKVISILILAALVFAGLQLVMERFVVQPRFVELEREGAQKDIEQCVSALEREIDRLDRWCAEWAARDDTYAFVADENPAYPAAHLTFATFSENRVDLIYFIHANGRVVWSAIYDLATGERIQIQDFPERRWATTHPLLQHRADGRALAGVITTQRGPMLVASRPIARGTPGDPIRGTLIVAGSLNQDFIDTLVAHTGVDCQFWPVQAEVMSAKQRAVLARLAQGEPYLIENPTGAVATVYATFPAVRGGPALLIRADVPTHIIARGQEAMRVATWLTMVIALAVLLVLTVFLRRVVTGPLGLLTDHVTAVTRSTDLSTIQRIDNKDEIGTLTREFNRMVRRIRADAEERKRAEDALGESEERYRSFVTHFNGIAFRGQMDFSPFFFHGAVEDITGYTEDDFLDGRPQWPAIVHPDDAPAFEQSMAHLRETPDYSDHREYRIVRKDGRVRWVHELVENVCDDSGKPIYVQGALYDITDLKEMHEQVLQTQHLATIGEMSASVAHEIKNPLAGISGAIQVLRDGLDPHDSRREVMDEVLDQVERVDATVRSLLTFAKTWTVEKQSANLRDITERVCLAAREREPFEAIRFAVQDGDGVWAPVDPGLTEQVLWNLFQNAAQAMPDGGEVRCAFSDGPDVARIMITDTGSGIPEDRQDKLFRPFFTTKTRGTGLGLAICRRILEAHGGTVRLTSTPGQGTAVTLEFPKGAC